MPRFIASAVVLAAGVASAGHAAGTEIGWEVRNAFPLLKDEQFNVVKKNWQRLPPSEQTMWNFIRMRLKDKEDGVAPPDEYLLADPPTSATSTESAAAGLRAKTAQVMLHAQGTHCEWVVEPPALRAPENGKCSTSMEVPIDAPLKVRLRDAPAEQPATQVRVREIVVVAMGDSYSAGEGSPDRPAIYPQHAPTPHPNDWFMRGLKDSVSSAVWWDPVCHRSLLSWPVLATMRLALERTDTVVRLVNVACSGAEFFNGFFWAQEREPVKYERPGSQLTSSRDGLGRRGIADASARLHYLRRSQVNAVRDVLCHPPSADVLSQVDVALPDRPFQASMRPCEFIRRPDALLLTAGGNDAHFAAAVRGVLVPSVSKIPIVGGMGLSVFRAAAQTISPRQLGLNAERWRPLYADYLDAVQRGVGVEASNTVLLGYPNPIGAVTDTCNSDLERARVRNAFMTLGIYTQTRTPFPASLFVRNWSVEIDSEELKSFSGEAYPAIQRMQDTVTDRLVNWHPERRASEAAPFLDASFFDRLLCTSTAPSAQSRQLQLEPFFFCSDGNVKPDECAVVYSGDKYHVEPSLRRRDQLRQWRFEAPDRRMTNSTNDSFLAQRTWDRKTPSIAELTYALAGSMHPVAESQGVGADAAYKRLLTIVKNRQGTASD